ncbi:DNA polymerase III subunit delta [Helicobacter sp. 23-1045]
MYKKDFDSLLKNALPKASLLWGECDFFINFYATKIKNLIKNNGAVDIFPLYFEEYNANQIIEILSQQSLFSNASLVDLKINKIKESTKKDISKFLQILKRNPNNYLIIEFYSDDSMDYSKNARALSALFNSNEFAAVRFFNPSQKEAIEILRYFSAESALKISDLTLNHLYEMQNYNLQICANELQKFSVFEGEITKELVDKLSYGLHAKGVDELCEALLNKDDYLEILSKMQEEGLQDMDLIRALQGYFYRLFQFFAYIKANGRVDCAKILKYALPKHIETKYTNFAMRLREPQYLGIFALLNEWRVNAISGKDKNSFANLIKLQAILR